MLEKKTYLSAFTIVEMGVLAKHMGLTVEIDGKSKSELTIEITAKAKEKFPFLKTTASGNLIIDPAHFL